MITYARDHNAPTFIVKYEDLANGPRQTLNSIYSFLGEDEPSTMDNSTRTQHRLTGCLFRDKEVGAHHVHKSAAFSNPWFISTLWDLVEKSAERFGYSKPSWLQPHDNATTFNLEEPLPSTRYLTYLPSGGGLSDQLLELEIAIQLAEQSGRKLIVTPLITGDSPPIPKNCDAHAEGLCATNLADTHTNDDPSWWGDIIDYSTLSGKIQIFKKAGAIPYKFSELTLCEFDRCTTHWSLHEPRKGGEDCRSDFSFGPRNSFNISKATRSTRCLFEATKEVNVLRFVDLIGTVDRNSVSAQVDFSSDIKAFANKKVLAPFQALTGGGAMHVCVELRRSRDAQAISEQLEAYFQEMDSENRILIYVSMKNHSLEKKKEQLDICTNRTCFFARDYFKHPSVDNFLFSAFDSVVCSEAHRVFTLSNETDWYTERIHRLRHSERNDSDACPQTTVKYSEDESISGDDTSISVEDDRTSVDDELISVDDKSITGNNESISVDDEKCRTLSITKETVSAQNTTDNSEGHSGFGGCLLIMDDNHFLVEWLGYHYHAMPLRRLIVAVDPKSKTSPKRILDRYSSRSLMNITIWDDSDFLSAQFFKSNENTHPVSLHRTRQRRFNADCLRTLQSEGMSWIMNADTDEYIVPNRYAWPSSTIQGQERKVIDMLNHHDNRLVNPEATDACHPMIRLAIGTKDSTELQVQKNVPLGFNGSEYMTLRYRWPQPIRQARAKLGKALLDVSKIPPRDIRLENGNPHRPNFIHCTEKGMFMHPRKSPFVVYHYTGSFEQFSYRADGRETRNWENFQERAFDAWSDDSARFWLKDFVDEVGPTLAKELLKGAGHVEPWNASTSDV
jgi:hypothetical protein